MYKVEGVITARNADGTFNVEVAVGDKKVVLRCFIAGRLKYKFKKVRLEVGDRVIVEVTPYDPAKGKIIRRLR